MKTPLVIALCVCVVSTAAAQQTGRGRGPTAAPPAQPAPPAPPGEPGVYVATGEPRPPADQPNVRFEFSITDEGGTAAKAQKTVTLVAQASGQGSLRSTASRAMTPVPGVDGKPTPFFNNPGPIDLNVDVRVAGWNPMDPDRLQTRITLDYQPFVADAETLPARIKAQVDVRLQNGKPFLLWQAADPISNRRSVIEVTATVLK